MTNSYGMGVLLVGLLVAGPLGCSQESKIANHFERANAYFEDGEFEKARIEYLNVVRLEPTNHVAIVRLATIHFDRGELLRAGLMFERARTLDPENIEIQRRLGLVYLSHGLLAKAKEAAEAVLVAEPRDEDAILVLAATPTNKEQLAEVRKRFEELRSETGNSAALELALGHLSLREGDPEAGEAAFKRALALDPASSRARMALGDLYWAQEKRAEAEALLEAAAEAAPGASRERIRLARFKLSTGAPEEGKRILEEISASNPYYVPVSTLLGEVALAERDFTECSNRVERVLTHSPNNYEALMLQARCNRIQGNPAEAIRILERAQRTYALQPNIEFELALAHRDNRDPGRAITSAHSAIGLNPRYVRAYLLLAELERAQRDFDSAGETLSDLIGIAPNIAPAYLVLANVRERQGRFDEALAALDEYSRRARVDVPSLNLKGRILRRQGKPTEAREAFAAAAAMRPEDKVALYQLVNLDLAEKQYDEALKRVQSALREDAESARSWYLLGLVEAARNRSDPAEQALNKAIELDPNYSEAYALLLRLYTSRGDFAAALARLDEFLAKNPEAIGAWMIKGMLHDREGQYAEARDAYTKLLEGRPDFALALNNLAYLYSERFDQQDKAYELATKARQAAPESAAVADTLGWILFRRGQFAEALPLLSRSVVNLPDNAEVQYHLGMVNYMMGEEEPALAGLQRSLTLSTNFTGRTLARRHVAVLEMDTSQPSERLIANLEARVSDRPRDVIAWKRLAEMQAGSGQTEAAKASYEKVRGINPNAVFALAALADLYAGPLDDSARAMELAKRARELAPSDPQVAHTLGRLAFASGDRPWAYSLLGEAARAGADNPDYLYDAGLAAYSLGRVSEGKAMVAKAVEVDPKFDRARAAAWFLLMVKATEQPTIPAGAEEQLTQLLQAAPNHVPALMVSGRLAERKRQPAEARRRYEKILAIYPEFTPAMARLAVLLAETDADDRQAYDLATKARSAFPQDPELAKALGKIVFRRGDNQYAAQLLQQAVAGRSRDAEAFYLLGLARNNLGQSEAGKQALEKALELAPQAEFAADARKILSEKE